MHWPSLMKGQLIISLILESFNLNMLFANFRFKNMPLWSGLIHFDQVVSINFTDAKKLDHLVKVLSDHY